MWIMDICCIVYGSIFHVVPRGHFWAYIIMLLELLSAYSKRDSAARRPCTLFRAGGQISPLVGLSVSAVINRGLVPMICSHVDNNGPRAVFGRLTSNRKAVQRLNAKPSNTARRTVERQRSRMRPNHSTRSVPPQRHGSLRKQAQSRQLADQPI